MHTLQSRLLNKGSFEGNEHTLNRGYPATCSAHTCVGVLAVLLYSHVGPLTHTAATVGLGACHATVGCHFTKCIKLCGVLRMNAVSIKLKLPL